MIKQPHRGNYQRLQSEEGCVFIVRAGKRIRKNGACVVYKNSNGNISVREALSSVRSVFWELSSSVCVAR